MSGTQTPASAGVESTDASSQTNTVHCKTCGRGFGRERNLRIHEAVHDEMLQHATQDTTEAIAKRLKYNTNHNTSRKKLRVNDPKYREKQRQISITNRMKKKASEADKENHVEPKDVSTPVDVESNDMSTPVDVESNDMSTPVDVESNDMSTPVDVESNDMSTPVDVESNDMSSCVYLGEDIRLHEEGGGGGGASRHVKKARIDDKSVFRVTTTALTTANINNFFSPKYNAPRSKAQRLAAPRVHV
jgi:hypothetical protein